MMQESYNINSKYTYEYVEKQKKIKEDEVAKLFEDRIKSLNKTVEETNNYLIEANNIAVKKQKVFNNNTGVDLDLNEYLSSIEDPFISSDNARKGITDRYVDPGCGADEFLYCLGGTIDCVDIYGDPIKDTLQDMSSQYNDYDKGKTYGKCGSYVSKESLSDYSRELTDSLIQNGNMGYYYDIVKCTPEKPWRVGGEGTPIDFNDCAENADKASSIYNLKRGINPSDFVNGGNVYIESEYIVNDYAIRFPDALQYLNISTSKFIGNQRMYKGVIKSLNTKNLFDVYVPDSSGVLLIDIEPMYLKLPTTNANLKKPISDKPPGYAPRPVCKGGKFTGRCTKGNYKPIEEVTSNPEPDELDKYLIKPTYKDTTALKEYNANNDFFSSTTIATGNNVLGFSAY